MTTHWHIIRCVSGQEGRAERYLERLGYPYGWHPTEDIRLSETRYKRLMRTWERLGRMARGDKPKRFNRKAYIKGYVFIPANEINFDRIKNNPYAWLEPITLGGVPYRLTNEKMTGMILIPDRLRELLNEVEQAKRAEWEAKRPKVGESAKVISGTLKGHVAQVASVSDGVVTFDADGLLGRVRVPETMVERAA